MSPKYGCDVLVLGMCTCAHGCVYTYIRMYNTYVRMYVLYIHTYLQFICIHIRTYMCGQPCMSTAVNIYKHAVCFLNI